MSETGTLPIEAVLRAMHVWDDLPGQVRGKVSAGSLGDLEDDLRPLQTEGGERSRQAALALSLLLAGRGLGHLDNASRRITGLPSVDSLLDLVRTKVDKLTPDEGEGNIYDDALTELVRDKVGPVSLAAIYLTLLYDGDEGLDLILAYDRLSSSDTRNVENPLLFLTASAPHLTLPLVNWLANPVRTSSLADVCRAGRFLSFLPADLACRCLDNLSDPFFPESLRKSLGTAMAEMASREEAEKLAQALELEIAGSLGKAVPRKPAERKTALQAIQKAALYLECCSLVHGKPDEVLPLARDLSTKPAWLPPYRSLRTRFATASLPADVVPVLFKAVVDAYGIEGFTVIEDYISLLSHALPLPTVILLVSHPSFIEKLEGYRKLGPSHFVDDALSLSAASASLQLFERFVERVDEASPLSPIDCLRYFGFLAMEELDGTADPKTTKPDWNDPILWLVLPPRDLLAEFGRIMDGVWSTLAAEDPQRKESGTVAVDHLLSAFHWKPVFSSPDPASSPSPDNPIILKQYRDIVHNAKRGDPRYPELIVSFARSLGKLKVRWEEKDRLFYRLDLLLNVSAQSFSPPHPGPLPKRERELPDVLPVLRADIEEMVGNSGLERGVDLGRFVRRLARLKHPQLSEVVDAVLDAAFTPPPRHQVNPEDDSPEMHVLNTVRTLFHTIGSSLEGVSLSERATGLLERAGEIARRMAAREDRSTLTPLVAAVERVFFGGRQEGEVNELTAGELVLPLPAQAALPSPADTAAPASRGPTPETATALVRLTEERSLAPFTMAPSSLTGMMEIHLGGGLTVPLWHAVAPVMATTARAAHRHWIVGSGGSPGETAQELSALDREQWDRDTLALVPAAPSDALALRERLERVRGLDSIRMALAATMGDVDPEEALLAEISRRVDLRHGLDLFEAALKSHLKDQTIRIADLKDLNRYLPNVTTFEVGLISLMDKVPRLILTSQGLAMVYLLTVAGAEWVDDTYDPPNDREGMAPIDPYIYMGVTGAGRKRNFTYYNPDVRRLIATILKTRLTDRHLFNHLWNNFPEAATMGLKKLKAEGNPRHLLNKAVSDVDYAKAHFPPSRLARLIGLLEKIPECLNRPEAVRVYVKPFGGGILFLDGEANPIEYVAYHPHLLREGMQTVYHRTEIDTTDDNPMAHQLLNDKLAIRVLDAVIAQTGGEVSLLEETTFAFNSRFRIHLPLVSRSIRVPDPFLGIEEFETVTSSLKVGTDEIAALTEALASIHPEILARARDGKKEGGGIRVIRKLTSLHADFVSMSADIGRLGEYNPADKSITLYHMQAKPFRNMDEVERQIYRDTLLHEVGEATFELFSPEERLSFISLYPWKIGMNAFDVNGHDGEVAGAVLPSAKVAEMSHYDWDQLELTPALTDQEIRRDLLTSYSSSNPRDLFCEAFMAYIAHGPEFRKMAEGSPRLAALYDWMKRHVFFISRGAVEHDQPAQVPLSDIEKTVVRWRADLHKRREDIAKQERHEAALEGFGDFMESTEVMAAQEEAAESHRLARGLDDVGYARGYFAMAELDEEGAKQREIAARYIRLEAILDTDSAAVVAAMVGVLEESVFADLIEAEERIIDAEAWGKFRMSRGDPERPDASLISGLIEEMAIEVYELMQEGDRRGAINRIEETLLETARLMERDDVSPFGEEDDNDGGERPLTLGSHSELNIDPDDIFEAMVEAAKDNMARGSSVLRTIVDALSLYLLPGEFTRSPLNRIREMVIESGVGDVAVITNLYRFLEKRREWGLKPERCAEIAAVIAEKLTHLGREVEASNLTRLMLDLRRGRDDLFTIAERCHMKPGAVDAFAESFLEKGAYEALSKRSEREKIRLNLELARSIHEDLNTQWVALHGTPHEMISSWIARLTGLLERFGKGEEEVVEEARAVLSDREHGRAIEELSSQVFREKIEKERKKGGGGGGGGTAGGEVSEAAPVPLATIDVIPAPPARQSISGGSAEIGRGSNPAISGQRVRTEHMVHGSTVLAVRVDDSGAEDAEPSSGQPRMVPQHSPTPDSLSSRLVTWFSANGLPDTARFVTSLPDDKIRKIVSAGKAVCIRLLEKAGEKSLAAAIRSGSVKLSPAHTVLLALALASGSKSDRTLALGKIGASGKVDLAALPGSLPLLVGGSASGLAPQTVLNVLK